MGDSALTSILNPEAVIFANPIAQGACAADAVASAAKTSVDALFWCAGSQGSMYPFNGWVSNESSPCSLPFWSASAWRSSCTVRVR